MKEFNKWYKNITKEYPLYQDKDGYNIGNSRALKMGWKAALELVLTAFKSNLATECVGDDYDLIDVFNMIEEELEED